MILVHKKRSNTFITVWQKELLWDKDELLAREKRKNSKNIFDTETICRKREGLMVEGKSVIRCWEGGDIFKYMLQHVTDILCTK